MEACVDVSQSRCPALSRAVVSRDDAAMPGQQMRGFSIRAFVTVALWLTILTAVPFHPTRAQEAEETDDRDIIRLLPPGRGSSDSAGPSQPDIPFPPSSGAVPGQGLSLKGQTIDVPIRFQPWPGRENLAYAGVRLDAVNDSALASALGLSTQAGIFVVDTTPGAPAAEAGLRFGDFILSLDATPMSETSDFVEAVKERVPGSQGQLSVWRVAEDSTGYLDALRSLADRGSTPAMMFLARLYSNGTGVGADASEAVSWYKKAALAGSTNGMLLYRDGEGMTKDPLEAVNLFKRAAEASYSPAMVAVGLMFEGGSGLEADHHQAVQWYKRAADAGDAEGMAALGTMYSTGRGVERNPATAASWYISAANRGQLLAIHNLAYHYDKGIGVGRDSQLAAGYIYQALEQRYQFTYQQMMQNSKAWSREFRKALQQRLAAGGYYTGTVDGTFGRTTYDAITAMMRAH